MKDFYLKPKKSNTFLFILIGLLPLGVSINPNDSTETNLHFMGGNGQFAMIERGCDGSIISKKDIPFREAGISIDHKTNSPVRIGLNANYLNVKKRDYKENFINYNYTFNEIWKSTNIIALNPFMNLEWKYFALGGGYIWSNKSLIDHDYNSQDNQFGSGYVRIGNVNSFYFDASLFHSTLFFSGSSFKMGLGFASIPNVKTWFGLGAGPPHDGGAFLTKVDIRIQQNLYLNTLLRLGTSEGIWENSIGLGISYKLNGNKF